MFGEFLLPIDQLALPLNLLLLMMTKAFVSDEARVVSGRTRSPTTIFVAVFRLLCIIIHMVHYTFLINTSYDIKLEQKT